MISPNLSKMVIRPIQSQLQKGINDRRRGNKDLDLMHRQLQNHKPQLQPASTTLSLVEPVKRRILHLNRSCSNTSRRLLPPRSLHAINLTNPRTPPSINKIQPINSPIPNTKLPRTRITRRGNIPRLLRDQKPRTPQIKRRLPASIEVVVSEYWD